MPNRLRGVLTSGVLGVLALPAAAWAAGGKPAAKLVSVADTRHATGLAKWIGDVYNTNLLLYGVVVVVTMVAMGLVLGLAFDRLLVRIGLDLGRLESHE